MKEGRKEGRSTLWKPSERGIGRTLTILLRLILTNERPAFEVEVEAECFLLLIKTNIRGCVTVPILCFLCFA